MRVRTTLEKVLWWLFLFLVVSLGFMKPFVVVGYQRLTPTDLIFPFAALCFFAVVISRSITLKLDRNVAAIVLYVAALGLSAIMSEAPAISWRKMAGVAYLAGIALAAYHIVDSDRRLRIVIFAFIAGSAVPIIIGLTTLVVYYVAPSSAFVREFTYHFGSVPVGNFPRVSSTFISASMFMNYLSVVIALVMIARSQLWVSNTTFYLIMAGAVICSMFTISIGLGAVFLLLGISVWALSMVNNLVIRRFVMTGGIMAAIGFVLIAPFALQPHNSASPMFSEPIFGSDIYPSARLLVWEEALDKFSQDLLTGVGIGLPSASVLFTNTDGSKSMLTDAHNVFLSIASQAGTVGLLALLYLCFETLRPGWRAHTGSTGNSVAAWLAIAFAVGFLYQGLTGSFEDARHLWLLIGLIPAAARIENGLE